MGMYPNDILNTMRGFFKSILEKMMIEERCVFLESQSETKGNGFYKRAINSLFGEITDLRIPRTRDSSFRSIIIPDRKTDCQLEQLITQIYSAGISTRKIEDILKKQFGVTLSHSSIARLSAVAHEEVLKWKQRPLKDYAAIFIDAFYFPLKRKTVEKEAVYVALGIDPEGHREVIGFWIPGGSEGASNWEEIFTELRARGVINIDYIVADGLTGISEAIKRVYPNAQYQYCILHASRSSLNKVRSSDKKQISIDLKEIYYANSKSEAKAALDMFSQRWKSVYPKVVNSWYHNFDSLTAFMSLPSTLRRYVYTTNWVERLHKEIKRRIKSMEQFQNETSAEKILYGLYTEQNKRYKLSGVNRWKDAYRKFKEKKD